ncbi:MAG TPA: spore germination protein GerW family protein [Solirubrobacterales bacterium]|jgi:uncharacterized spore protein YtfJ|nr:spore germination protein GerW family protein [Solirubrobacterales bacterium]
MNLTETIADARDAITVKRVYGEAYEQDGITIIPAAMVMGGGGGGEGQQDEGQTGSGGGFGLRARPVGAYVVRDGQVAWQPAFDLNRVILGGQLVAVAALFVIGSILRRRS